MKYIKKFESINDTFIIGDIVTTLNNMNVNIPSGMTGMIEDYHSGSRYSFDIKFNYTTEKYWLTYFEIRFATPEEIEKYNLEKTANTYNL